MSEERLSGAKLALFSLPAIPAAMLLMPVSFFLPAYFTTELGLSLSAWAAIILIARIWDIVTDPIAGVVCDRFPSRWGRRRHWLVIGVPVLMIACVLLLLPEYFISGMTVVYALLAMCLLQLGQTVFGLNHQAWGAEISTLYHERSRIMGWRSAIGGIAPLFAFGIPMIVERTTSDPSVANTEKLRYLAYCVLVLLPVTTAIAVRYVPERPSQLVSKARVSMLESWKLLVSNSIMLRIIVIEIFAALPFSIAIALNVFYVSYVLEAPEMVSTLLVVIFLATLISMPIWIRISARFEKHKFLTFTYSVGAVFSATLVFLGPGDIVLFAILASCMGVFTSAPSFLLRSIIADVVDSDTLATGEERTGTFYALMEMTQKFVPAIAVPLVFPFLQLMGFDPALGVDNTEEALAALRYSFAIFPPIPMVIAAVLLYTFPMDRSKQEEAQREIQARHGADNQ